MTAQPSLKPRVDLRRISTGRQRGRDRFGIYGPESVGKSSLAAGAPKPLFLDVERGTLKLNVQRVHPEDWKDFLDWLDAIAAGEVGDYESIVVDSLTRLEEMMHAHIFGTETKNNVTSYGGGYGKGDDFAVREFRIAIEKLERIWLGGRNIILIAHSVVKKFEDPTSSGWERYEMGCRPKLAGAIKKWLDFLFFIKPETTLSKDEKSRGIATGERIIHTRWSAAYDAKARGELELPDAMLLSVGWTGVAHAIAEEETRVERLRSEIDAMLKEIGDANYEAGAQKFIRENPRQLAEVHKQILKRKEEKKK